MKKRIVPEEEKQQIIYDYVENHMGQKALSKKYHTSDRNIKAWLQEWGIPIKNVQETNVTRYYINEKFFDVESSDMAYILGLLASDGCISGCENCIYIELQEQDYQLLEDINKKLENERPVKFYTTQKGYKNCKLYFFSKTIKDKLLEYNLMPNKTYNQDFNFPLSLNRQYWIDYIRGYFDGDGSIKTTGTALTFQIDGVKYEILEQMQLFFKEEYNIECSITKTLKKDRILPMYRLYCYGAQAQKIFEAMYYTDNQLRLLRKYNKFLSLKK